MNIQIRPIQPTDYSVLEDFLYHAIYIPDDEEYPPREIIFTPEIYIYIKDFGLDTDCGVVAEDLETGKIVGAAWTRIIPAYGHLDKDTPELAISILPKFRGRRVGTMLMNRLFELLRERGFKRTSLSVQQNNPAVRFYKRLGYKITDEKIDHAGHEDYIMVKNLTAHTEMFSGKATAYAAARPSYPDEAIDYITSLVSENAVFADIGAGTGKFTECLAKRGVKLFAVEPNADMREQLSVTLTSYPNARIVAAPAESTTLLDNSVDVITVAQALHWFDPVAFRAECRRIGKLGAVIVAVYNRPREEKIDSRGRLVIESFFSNLTKREFDNPVFYTRESWIQYMSSHSSNPLPTDSGYEAHIKEVNAIFDRESVDEVLRRDVVTRVYHEVI
jgi:ribosomal protein S18 acetylase RimI-like enzyme/ubiquinone/menaquinone biosynthesis C-methylase UbiE